MENKNLPSGWGSVSGNNLPEGWGNQEDDSVSCDSTETAEDNAMLSEYEPTQSKTKMIAGIVAAVVLIPVVIFGFVLLGGDGGDGEPMSSTGEGGSESKADDETNTADDESDITVGGNAGNSTEESPLDTITETESTHENLVWRVQPELEYEDIFRCVCGYIGVKILDENGYFDSVNAPTINTQTGLIINGEHLPHGGWSDAFVYDEGQKLFGHPGLYVGMDASVGMHPLNEFNRIADGWTIECSSKLIAVQSVDSSLRQDLDGGEGWWSLDDNAYLGRFAVMYNREFVTDFIFDKGASYALNGSTDFDSIAMSIRGNWGLIDRFGNELTPFIFEDIIHIDDNTAFAKYNGKYGILDIYGTV